MPAANALNYLALQDAVLGRRFPAASQRNNAKRWLATAYQDVWSAEDWTFKRINRVDLTVTAGDSTPTMPADFQDAIELFDTFGEPVLRFDHERFEETFSDVLSFPAVGLPEGYTVVNRQIEIAPLPQGGTYKLTYFRRLSHKESDGVTVTPGFFDTDTDYPLWDDHHSILIPRAQAIGLIELNDPSFDMAMAEYERQLSRMKDDYVQMRTQQQWGAWA